MQVCARGFALAPRLQVGAHILVLVEGGDSRVAEAVAISLGDLEVAPPTMLGEQSRKPLSPSPLFLSASLPLLRQRQELFAHYLVVLDRVNAHL